MFSPDGDFQRATSARYLGPEIDLPILPANIDRFDDFRISGPGSYEAPLQQGLVRYVRVRLDTPGAAMRIARVRFENRGTYATEPVAGSFSCSDPALEALWRASVRTCQLAAIPARTTPLRVPTPCGPATLGPHHAYLSDGAKRDRLVWSGDLWFAQRNLYAAWGPESPYLPGSLRMLAESQTPDGYVQACPYPESHGPVADGDYGPFQSDEFAAWFVPVLWDHLLYTGDFALARELYPNVLRLMGYLSRHTRGDGLFEQCPETSKHAAGLVFGGDSTHHRAYMNVLLWLVRRDAALLARAVGRDADAAAFEREAEATERAVRIDYEDTGITRVNQDWAVRYPPGTAMNRSLGLPGREDSPGIFQGKPKPRFIGAAQRRQPLRGCMLPQRATTEDDIATLAAWGATLVRFQITRDFGKIDANLDLDEYATWVDSRLDNLEEVLGWAEVRGMKVCVDLHATPGGVRAGDRATAMLYDERLADAFVETWRRIAARCVAALQTAGLYGYDLVNEPKQIAFAPISYWEIQRRAAEAIRAIDPDTPIIVESNISASPSAFAYLSPLAMDNVIYQLHMYAPGDYTHQGVGRALLQDGRPLVWPDPSRGWDADWLRRVLEPVRAFQEKHRCRIYVGEFSAVAWAPGAENYLRDCIAIFEEYGWDWTYHAFREWSAWSVEHEVPGPGKPPTPSANNPRRSALLEGLR